MSMHQIHLAATDTADLSQDSTAYVFTGCCAGVTDLKVTACVIICAAVRTTPTHKQMSACVFDTVLEARAAFTGFFKAATRSN